MQACVPGIVVPASPSIFENFAYRPFFSKVLQALFLNHKLKNSSWYTPAFFTTLTRGFSRDVQSNVESRRRLRCKASLTECRNKRRCVPAEDTDSDNEVKEVFPEEASFCVDTSAELKATLHCEVFSAFSDFSVGVGHDKEGPPWRCTLRRWRAWSCQSRLLGHIRKKHTDGVKFACSGTKQLKVVMSMYSLDSFTGRHPNNYLQRSSDLVRTSASLAGRPLMTASIASFGVYDVYTPRRIVGTTFQQSENAIFFFYKKSLTALRQTLKNATTLTSNFPMRNSAMMTTTRTRF